VPNTLISRPSALARGTVDLRPEVTFVFRHAHLSSPPIFTSSAATSSTALEHPNAGCYTGQRIFVVRREVWFANT
jgi:hypothetical protein